MNALFVELPPFERHRSSYLDDEAFSRLQTVLLADPKTGEGHPGNRRVAEDAVQ